jgi:hypothetical protein
LHTLKPNTPAEHFGTRESSEGKDHQIESRQMHIRTLLNTPGFGHLTAESAGHMVDDMRRLCLLLLDIHRAG